MIEQKALQHINRKGSILSVSLDGEKLSSCMLDSIIVLKKSTESVFLLIKEAGYNNDPHCSHTLRAVNVFIEEEIEDEHAGTQYAIIEIEDDQGRLNTVEMIEPSLFPAEHKQWVKWNRYKNENKELFHKVDEKILKEHQEIADTWN